MKMKEREALIIKLYLIYQDIVKDLFSSKIPSMAKDTLISKNTAQEEVKITTQTPRTSSRMYR